MKIMNHEINTNFVLEFILALVYVMASSLGLIMLLNVIVFLSQKTELYETCSYLMIIFSFCYVILYFISLLISIKKSNIITLDNTIESTKENWLTTKNFFLPLLIILLLFVIIISSLSAIISLQDNTFLVDNNLTGYMIIILLTCIAILTYLISIPYKEYKENIERIWKKLEIEDIENLFKKQKVYKLDNDTNKK